MPSQPGLRASLEQLQRRLAEPPGVTNDIACLTADLSDLARGIVSALEDEFDALTDLKEPNAA